MFDAFPDDYQTVINWQWTQFASYAQDLVNRELTEDTIHHWLEDWSKLGRMIWELRNRLEVATTVDTNDKEAESQYENFMNNIFPEYIRANHLLNRKLLASGIQPPGFAIPLRNIQAETALFREENIPLLIEEELLNKEYDKITGAQTVIWEGEEKTIAQLRPIYQDQDRHRREQIFRLVSARQLQDRDALNQLWVKLIGLRQRIASNANCADFREYRWKALKRFDYTPEDAQTFFDAIEQVIVPAAERIYEKQRQRLGIDSLRPWDLEVDPLGRAPLRPFNSVATLEQLSESIFEQVSPRFGNYIRIMRKEKLLDLDNRKGKAPGGYCTEFPVIKRPFIFMNAVGLHDDVQTMLHESGHAFHVFETVDLPYIHQQDVPIEFAEVASMSMELLAAPYLKRDRGGFYSEEETARARIEHLESIIKFWPYMAVVASFQHWAYTNIADATKPANCDAIWKELYLRFMKGIDFTGLDSWLETGWHRKLHIFRISFYYIEYGLAQLGAAQIWANSLQNQPEALAAYRRALSLGGTASLPDLFKAADVQFAFDAETLERAAQLIEKTITELEANS